MPERGGGVACHDGSDTVKGGESVWEVGQGATKTDIIRIITDFLEALKSEVSKSILFQGQRKAHFAS